MFNSGHKFKTSKEDRKGNAVRFICAFLAFAVVFGGISAVVILKNNEISMRDIFGDKQNQTTLENPPETSAGQTDRQISGSAKVLVYCANNDVSEIYFMALINADMDRQTLTVQPLKANRTNYLNALRNGGYKSLISEVEKTEDVRIDKYAASNTDTFALAINYMGGLKYTVESRIEYRTDTYTLILTQGSQTIKGESLLNYFRYCKDLGDDGLRVQGKLICAMLDNYINEENVKNGMTIYKKILSKINSDTDISYVEAAKAMQVLEVFSSSEDRQPATIILIAD